MFQDKQTNKQTNVGTYYIGLATRQVLQGMTLGYVSGFLFCPLGTLSKDLITYYPPGNQGPGFHSPCIIL